MSTEFIEHYNKLSDMEVGDMAVSKDRRLFFVCGYYYDKEKKKNIKIILDLNHLAYQYTDMIKMEQPVKILIEGDKFICEK